MRLSDVFYVLERGDKSQPCGLHIFILFYFLFSPLNNYPRACGAAQQLWKKCHVSSTDVMEIKQLKYVRRCWYWVTLSPFLSKKMPHANIGCLIDNEARKGLASPIPSHLNIYRPFDSEFSPTCLTQWLLSCWPHATSILQAGTLEAWADHAAADNAKAWRGLVQTVRRGLFSHLVCVKSRGQRRIWPADRPFFLSRFSGFGAQVDSPCFWQQLCWLVL